MKHTTFAMAVITATLMIAGTTYGAPFDCEPARCAVQDAINQQCPCDAPQFTNHGRYVSCVAHVVNQLAKDGTIPTQCKGKVKRCAARSTCGKAGFVTCQIPIIGTCDVTTGTCTTGTLTAGLLACTADTDCQLGSRCLIKKSADLCLAKGGTAGQGTCCPGCVTPPPAP